MKEKQSHQYFSGRILAAQSARKIDAIIQQCPAFKTIDLDDVGAFEVLLLRAFKAYKKQYNKTNVSKTHFTQICGIALAESKSGQTLECDDAIGKAIEHALKAGLFEQVAGKSLGHNEDQLVMTKSGFDGWKASMTPAAPATVDVPLKKTTPSNTPAPIEILLSWDEIFDALKRNKSTESRRKLIRLNSQLSGPIPKVPKGGQPRVDKSKLLAWWNGLSDGVTVQEATSESRIENGSGALGERVYDGKVAYGHVKKDQRSTGKLARKK